MGRIIVSENVSLDGVAEDPTGDEGFPRGGWFHQVGAADRTDWARIGLREALAAEALLLGRRSDEWFAARWLSRTGEWADRLNSMRKYVVSASGHEPRWGDATVLTDVTEVVQLKRDISGDVVVYGSIRLVHTLLDHDLVDELRLTVYPVVLGAGERIFPGTGTATPLALVEARTVGDDLVLLTYRPRPIA